MLRDTKGCFQSIALYSLVNEWTVDEAHLTNRKDLKRLISFPWNSFAKRNFPKFDQTVRSPFRAGS